LFFFLFLLPCLPAATSLQGQQQLLPNLLAAQNPRRGTSLTESLPGFYFPVFCRLQSDRKKFPILPCGLVEVSDSATSVFSVKPTALERAHPHCHAHSLTTSSQYPTALEDPPMHCCTGAPQAAYGELLYYYIFQPLEIYGIGISPSALP